MSKFPECFPENFESDILPKGAKKENKEVYRVIKYGEINRDSFISTYEEMKLGLIPMKKKYNPQDPSLYSTSCNINSTELEYVLSVFMRHYPKVFIARGETEGSCGPSQLTSEREIKRKDGHVDWWIYKDSNPEKNFEEVE